MLKPLLDTTIPCENWDTSIHLTYISLGCLNWRWREWLWNLHASSQDLQNHWANENSGWCQGRCVRFIHTESVHTTTIAMEIQTRIWLLHDFHIVKIFQVLPSPVPALQLIVAWEAPDVHLTHCHNQALLCYLGHGLHNQFTTLDFDTVQIMHTKEIPTLWLERTDGKKWWYL